MATVRVVLVVNAALCRSLINMEMRELGRQTGGTDQLPPRATSAEPAMWYKDNELLPESRYRDRPNSSGNITLYLVKVGRDDIGTYTVSVENSHGTVSSQCEVDVIDRLRPNSNKI